MVGEPKRDVLAGLAKQAGQHANAVDQQARIGRLVDRCFDDRRVAPRASTKTRPVRDRGVSEALCRVQGRDEFR